MTDPLNVETEEEPRQLRFLRRLVTGLTAVMVCGLVVIVALLVIRLSNSGPQLPENIALPAGTQAQAVTFGDGWIAVVTTDERILILNSLSGAIRQEITLKAE
ncbi:DUF6476 family protein [Sulfitobacter pontiacus]|uniref:DUF6476 family protein n=1 Tax=Sulfitobacter pontiacus TaxID=60137 RepID=UPI00329A0E9B